MAFVHFGIHTEFSITDSIVRIKGLIKAAKADHQLALAITDLSIYMPQVKFYKACLDAEPQANYWVSYLDGDNAQFYLLATKQGV